MGVGVKEFGLGGDVVGACGDIEVCARGVVTEEEEEEDVVVGDGNVANFNLSIETNFFAQEGRTMRKVFLLQDKTLKCKGLQVGGGCGQLGCKRENMSGGRMERKSE